MGGDGSSPPPAAAGSTRSTATPLPRRARCSLPARAAAAAAGVEETWASGRHSAAFELLAVAEQVGDAADVGLLVGQHKCGPLAGAAGAAGATDPVHVAFAVLGRVVVDHVEIGRASCRERV